MKTEEICGYINKVKKRKKIGFKCRKVLANDFQKQEEEKTRTRTANGKVKRYKKSKKFFYLGIKFQINTELTSYTKKRTKLVNLVMK